MNEPEPDSAPQQERPLWQKLLRALAVLFGLALLGLVLLIGFVIFTCSTH